MRKQENFQSDSLRDAWVRRGQELAETNQHAAAEQHLDLYLNDAIRLANRDTENDNQTPYDAYVYFLWARSCYQQGKYKKAYDIARWAASRFDKLGLTKEILRVIEAGSRQHMCAGTWAIEHYPHWPSPAHDGNTPLALLFEKLESYIGRGQYVDALTCLEKAERMAPDFFYTFFCLAIIENKIDSKEQAIEFLRQSLVLYPGNVKTLEALVPLLLKKRETRAEGEKLLMEALDIDPDNFSLNIEHVRLLIEQGNFKTAENILEAMALKARETKPEFAPVLERDLQRLRQTIRNRNAYNPEPPRAEME